MTLLQKKWIESLRISAAKFPNYLLKYASSTYRWKIETLGQLIGSSRTQLVWERVYLEQFQLWCQTPDIPEIYHSSRNSLLLDDIALGRKQVFVVFLPVFWCCPPPGILKVFQRSPPPVPATVREASFETALIDVTLVYGETGRESTKTSGGSAPGDVTKVIQLGSTYETWRLKAWGANAPLISWLSCPWVAPTKHKLYNKGYKCGNCPF